MQTKTLLSFGHGYCAKALTPQLLSQGWVIYGTTRSAENLAKLGEAGVRPILWGDDIMSALEEATHVLISAAPSKDGDPILAQYGAAIAAAAKQLRWAGYLSTTGVYGDHGGDWVDENTPPTPSTTRGQRRVDAEYAWNRVPDLPLHIFRLAGIYGPGRGPFAKVKSGQARRIIKTNQVFSRIHVADIAQIIEASINAPNPGAIYNLCDDDPAPPQDVIAYAAQLLNLPIPPAEPFEQAEMSPMARSFYQESKRVRNGRVKQELGISLLYPDYRTGLRALLAEEDQ